MRSIVMTGYGDLDKLELRDVERPTTGPSQLLLQVKAASINPIDWKLRRGHLRLIWPLKFPFTPGFDVAGVVESHGLQVTQGKVGDRIYAALPKGGGHSEYVAVDESLCAPIPPTLSFEEAAAIPGGALSALQALRDVANIQAGNHVIVNGASGGVGTFAVQIAVALGCQVTAVCSTANVDLVKSLGADNVIDYTQDDVLDTGPCDVFFDVVPNRSFRACSSMLSQTGIYITTLPGPGPLIWKAVTLAGRAVGYKKRCGWLIIKPSRDDMAFVSGLVSEGKVRPIVHRTYTLDEIREANAQSETGHASGKIVLQIA